MQKIYFISYADEKYSLRQQLLADIAISSRQFDEVISYSDNDIIRTEFYEKHKDIFDAKPIGDDGRVKKSWFLWKPFLIHETLLNRMNANDILMYIDCGDSLHDTETLREFLIKKTKNIDVVLTQGAFPSYKYTKRDAFFYMNADSSRYHNSIQIEAGIFVAKKTAFTHMVVSKWLRYASDRRVISDDKNTCGLDNLNGFIHHRWDQAILSIVAEKMDICRTDEMRKFVTCNKYD